MKPHSNTIDVEIVGFTSNERTIFASMFKVAGMQARAGTQAREYREWKPDSQTRPDCLLLDTDDADGQLRLDLEAVRKSGTPIVTVSKSSEKKSPAGAHISRPIRWAGVLHTLDTVLGETGGAPLTGKQAEEFNNQMNDLELQELQPWYDRNQPPKEFKTEASVLVVDPDPVISDLISGELKKSGYRVDHATAVSEAAALMKANRYNCVVLEMDLPNDEGIKFCAKIKGAPDPNRRTAVIILTSNSNIVDRVRGSGAGCDAYLSKPIDPKNLMTALEKFLPNWQKN